MANSLQDLFNFLDVSHELQPELHRNKNLKKLITYIVEQQNKEPAYLLTWATYRDAFYRCIFSEAGIRDYYKQKYPNLTEELMLNSSLDKFPKMLQSRIIQEFLNSLYPDILKPHPTTKVFWSSTLDLDEERKEELKELKPSRDKRTEEQKAKIKKYGQQPFKMNSRRN